VLRLLGSENQTNVQCPMSSWCTWYVLISLMSTQLILLRTLDYTMQLNYFSVYTGDN